MNDTIILLIVAPISIFVIVLLFKSAKKIDKFQRKVREYIETKRPEIKIIRQVGFGYEIQINDKVYPAWLHHPYKKYKKNPDTFENIIEDYLFSLPFKVGGKDVKK